MKNFEIEDVVREVLSSSINHGRQFGSVKNLPCDCEEGAHTRKVNCANENCHGVMFDFVHLIDKRKTTRYGKDGSTVTFLWDPNLSGFELSGEYCPVCEHTRVEIDRKTVREKEGDI